MRILKETTMEPFEGEPTPKTLAEMVGVLKKKYERRAQELDNEGNTKSSDEATLMLSVVADLDSALRFFGEESK